ncbi:membrane hypothetical protein [Candidatus Sulfopaludibacter sp. SbA3]|nr:membrane hypothetical protein [Candidatus Sulfopaludibacter sp. SbA3]
MLLSWLQCGVGFSIVAVAWGCAIGLIAKRRGWPAKRAYQTGLYGFLASLIVIGPVLEILLRLELPWPPHLLSQRGFPLAVVVAVAFISLFAWLAGSLAQRLRSPTDAVSPST